MPESFCRLVNPSQRDRETETETGRQRERERGREGAREIAASYSIFVLLKDSVKQTTTSKKTATATIYIDIGKIDHSAGI